MNKDSSNTPLTRKITLFSVLPPQSILAQFDAGFIAEPSSKEKVLGLWQNANKAYKSVGTPSRSCLRPGDIRTVPDTSDTNEFLSRVKKYPPFDSHNSGIYEVRLSRLVTPQVVINIQRANERMDVAKENLDGDSLNKIMFASKGSNRGINRQILAIVPNGGALLFTTYDEDVRIHHPPQYRVIGINEKDPSSPAYENVCFPVGGSTPFASAFRVINGAATRLILNNGIHRAYKLAEMGYEWMPIIVTDLLPIELQDPFVDLPKSLLLDPNENPPLITDFLNSNIVIPLLFYQVLKTVRLNWNVEQYMTVLK